MTGLYARLPFKFLSRCTGMVARLNLPRWMLRRAIDRYSSSYGVNTGEMIVPPGGFRTFNEFFTRRLREDAREVDADRRAVVSPVDGRIDQFGRIESSTLVQAKGITYSVEELIPSAMAGALVDGSFVTIYLSPGDYHRIHSPVDGVITGYMHVPGRLLSVRESVARRVPGLYTGNERVITYISTERGMVTVCKVGAANVGAISLSYDAAASKGFTNTPREVEYAADERKPVRRGDELGIFNLGSTVIVLFEKGDLAFTADAPGMKIQLGKKIAAWSGRAKP